MKKLFSKIAALGALMVGALAIGGVAHKEPVTAKAAGWSITFEVNVSQFAGWGGCSGYSVHTYTSGGTQLNGSWGSTGQQMKLDSGNNYKITISYKDSDVIGGMNFYFKQNGDQKQSSDIKSFGGKSTIDSSMNGAVYTINIPSKLSWSGSSMTNITVTQKSGPTVEPEPVIPGKQNWYIVGDFQGTWDPVGTRVEWNATNKRYEVLNVSLTEGNYFRFIKDSTTGWTGINTGWSYIKDVQDVSKYFKAHPTNEDDNIQILKTDIYSFWFEDDFKNFGFSVPEEKVNVNYYNGSKLLFTDEIVPNTSYSAKFYHETGYKLEGWYTDTALANAYTEKVVSDELNLYGKFTEAEFYGVYMKNTNNWAQPYAYMHYNDGSYDNAAWPGAKMTQVAGTSYWYYETDTGVDWSLVIFNDGSSNQTHDLKDITIGKTNIYEIATSKTTVDGKTNYAATKKDVRKVVAHIPADAVEYSELNYNKSATAVGISAITLDKGAVVLDSNVTADEAKAALIERMQGVDTCTDYDKVAELRQLAGLVAGYETIEISDRDDQNGGQMTATVTIGDKLDYMAVLADAKAEAVNNDGKANGALLSLKDNGSVSLIALFAILGLVAVSAYYFLEKRKLAK